jgi:hypothetical protein
MRIFVVSKKVKNIVAVWYALVFFYREARFLPHELYKKRGSSVFCWRFCVVSLRLHQCLGMRVINVLIEIRCQSSLGPGVHRTRSSSILSEFTESRISVHFPLVMAGSFVCFQSTLQRVL